MKSPSPAEQTQAAVERAHEHVLDYVRLVHGRRVAPDAMALAGLNHLDEPLPRTGCGAERVLDLLHEWGSPATTATTGGRFFGLVVGGSLPASMGAAMLNAAWDQVAILDAVAPSAIYLERLAARWVLDLLGLPAGSSVGFSTGSSMANFIGLAAARHTLYGRLGVDIHESGMSRTPPLRVVLSEQAHVTVIKALHLLGLGTRQFTFVPCDEQGRMRADALPTLGPETIVCLQAGNVNSGASDPFSEIVSVARAQGAWVHVDGAFGLWAAASPALRPQVMGMDGADSWTVDAHKWLNTPYDCGLAICRNPLAVHAAMSTVAPYLQAGHQAAPKDMVTEFSRRARGVEVWAGIKQLGRDGVINLLDRTCGHARTLATGLREMGFEILNEVVLNQVVASIGPPELTEELARTVQAQGECWFGTTVWRGRSAIRLSVASWATTDADIQRTLAAIGTALHRCRPQTRGVSPT